MSPIKMGFAMGLSVLTFWSVAQLPLDCQMVRQLGEFTAVVELNGKFGILDTEDSILFIHPVFDEVGMPGEFHPEWVMSKRSGLFGAVHVDGFEVYAPAFDEIKNLGSVHPDVMVVKLKGRLGLISGHRPELILPAEYDEILPGYEMCGMAMPVRKGKMIGLYCPVREAFILPVRFDAITPVGDGGSEMIAASRGGKMGLFTSAGKDVTGLKYDSIVWNKDAMQFECTVKGNVVRLAPVTNGVVSH